MNSPWYSRYYYINSETINLRNIFLITYTYTANCKHSSCIFINLWLTFINSYISEWEYYYGNNISFIQEHQTFYHIYCINYSLILKANEELINSLWSEWKMYFYSIKYGCDIDDIYSNINSEYIQILWELHLHKSWFYFLFR